MNMIAIHNNDLTAIFREKQVEISDKVYKYSSQRELTIEFPHVLYNEYNFSPKEVLEFMETYFNERGDNFLSEDDIIHE